MLRARKAAPTLDFAIPAINIVFLLLLFFINSGSVSNHTERSIAPPFVRRLPADRLPRPLLGVSASGALYLDGVAIEAGDLGPALARRRAVDPSALPVLNVLPERSLSAKAFLALAARLRGEVGVPLRLVTVLETDGR